MTKRTLTQWVLVFLTLVGESTCSGAIITDPDDPRTWQGAGVGTFADLFYGSDTAANRQLVVDNQLLDDGIFDPTGYQAGTLLTTPWSSGSVSTGQSLDSTGTGSYDYSLGGNVFTAANGIDDLWIQTSGTIGDAVWDLGASLSKAAIFNTIDHGPLPQEAIESTAYLSNDLINWTQAVTERVWLEGFKSNTGILWDGFAYAVGTGTSQKFRYVSIIWGGPGSFHQDGDNEINGVMGLNDNFQPPPPSVPEPSTWALAGIAALAFAARRRSSR